MEYTNVIADIQSLPHARDLKCHACGTSKCISTLDIQSVCSNCGAYEKHRSFGAPLRIEDVIVAAIVWIVEHDNPQAIFDKWKTIIELEKE